MAEANSVVYPTDFSELSLQSLPWAKRLSAVLDAQLHCVYVVEEPNAYASLDVGAVLLPTIAELEAGAQKRLNEFSSDHLGGADGDVTTKVLTGRSAQEIVKYADEQDAALIVMSTHGYTGIKHVLMGSTTEAVLRHARCLVLAVPGS